MRGKGYSLLVVLLCWSMLPVESVLANGVEESTVKNVATTGELDSASGTEQDKFSPQTGTTSSEQNTTEATSAETAASVTTTTTEATTSSTSATENSQEDDRKEQRKQVRSEAGTAEASSWAAVEQALSDQTVTTIRVTADVTATKVLTITRAVTLDFSQHQVNLKGYSLKVMGANLVTVKNVTFTGTAAGALLTGTGQACLAGEITADASNLSSLASMSGGTLSIDGAKVNYQRGKNATAAITAKKFTITNQASVTSTSKRFYAISAAADAGAEILIEKGSKVVNQSLYGGTDGQVWNITRQANLTIKDQQTSVDITGNHRATADSGGLFLIDADNSSLNLLDGAKMTIHSVYASAILLQSKGGVFNVRNHSELHLLQDSSGSYTLGATLRFRLKGNMTFNVENQSTIEIEKNGGSAPAIRMYGGNNLVNVAGGSDFIVKNKGTGKAVNPGVDGGNQGILYTAGGNNGFSLQDEDSNVLIEAENGAAIDSGVNSNTVSAKAGTYFIARGKTASTGYGIFNAGTLNFQMDQLKYFDFQNSNHGILFDASAASTFTSKNSDVQVWKTTADIEGDPTYAWCQTDYSLKGTDLNTLVSSSNPDLLAKWGATKNYSRMTANNQSAQIDDLRVPTDADKKIVAHAVVPEGKGELRNAYTDEVNLVFGVDDATGKEQLKIEALSNGEALSVYGEEPREGYIVAQVPNDQFLTANWQVKTLSGASGKNGENWLHPIVEKDLYPQTVEVYDVTPPQPATLFAKNGEISPYLEQLSGTGEPAAQVLVYQNGKRTQQETMIAADGTFTVALPKEKKKGDVLQIVLRDAAGRAEVLNPPATNSVAGNQQPLVAQAYHDAQFLAASTVEVVGTLELSSVPSKLDFGQHPVSAKTESYAPQVVGNLAVSDTRGSQKMPWRLLVKESTALTNGTYTLTNVLYYQKATEKIAVNSANTVVESDQFTEDKTANLSEKWNQSYGLILELPVEKQRVGEYQGTLTWTLEDVPENK